MNTIYCFTAMPVINNCCEGTNYTLVLLIYEAQFLIQLLYTIFSLKLILVLIKDHKPLIIVLYIIV